MASHLVRILSISIVLIFIHACSHPIEIVGEGDVTSASGTRNCYLEDFQAADDKCTKNYAIGAYQETYYATPRPGWKFERWVNYCASAMPPSYDCSFTIAADAVLQFWGQTAPPLQAVFILDGGQAITDTVMADGKEWAQVDLFAVTWYDINAVCPDGECIPGGVLNGYDMTGWKWASVDDINGLFNYYIGGEVLGPGPENYIPNSITTTWAPAFFASGWRGVSGCQPTSPSCSLYAYWWNPENLESGWVASLDDVWRYALSDAARTNIRDFNRSSQIGGWFFR